ncbi:MAG: hypothetical protein J2P54_08185 [Bradyrhizobiaceae bacterium]|nr:hypothetical protein [Bradyrhizobiaceae bacterium]
MLEHLAVGADFGVAPEIVANFVEVIETGSDNLTLIPELFSPTPTIDTPPIGYQSLIPPRH